MEPVAAHVSNVVTRTRYFEYFRFQRSAKLIKWIPRLRTMFLTSFEQTSATDSACRCA